MAFRRPLLASIFVGLVTVSLFAQAEKFEGEFEVDRGKILNDFVVLGDPALKGLRVGLHGIADRGFRSRYCRRSYASYCDKTAKSAVRNPRPAID